MIEQTIVFLRHQQIARRLGEDDFGFPVTSLSPGETYRLAELGRLRGGVEVWRDQQRSLTAQIVDEEVAKSMGIYYVLSISASGRIAHYDRNQPTYFPNLSTLTFNLTRRET